MILSKLRAIGRTVIHGLFVRYSCRHHRTREFRNIDSGESLLTCGSDPNFTCGKMLSSRSIEALRGYEAL